MKFKEKQLKSKESFTEYFYQFSNFFPRLKNAKSAEPAFLSSWSTRRR